MNQEGVPVAETGDMIFMDTIFSVFKKRKTAFLTTDKILVEMGFQKEVFPKEDRERLAAILERMREQEWVLTNQPKFVALTDLGKEKVAQLTEERMEEIEKAREERLK